MVETAQHVCSCQIGHMKNRFSSTVLQVSGALTAHLTYSGNKTTRRTVIAVSTERTAMISFPQMMGAHQYASTCERFHVEADVIHSQLGFLKYSNMP